MRVPGGRSWAVIARAGIRALTTRRAFIGLLLVSWFPFFVRAVQMYAAANVPQAAFLAPTPDLFRRYLAQQDVFVFFITVYAGSGLIANDRRAGALQVYLSKPLTRVEYAFGKLVILLVFLLFVTWVPAVGLLLVQIMFAGNFTFFRSNLHLFPAITLFSFVLTLTMASAMLALSSLSKSSRYVGVLYAAVIFFSQAIYAVLYGFTRDSRFAWISVPNDLAQVGDAIFRLPLEYKMPVSAAAAALVVVIAAAGAILERRVRGVEIVL